MEIVILHYHGYCPLCGKLSCIYVDFYKDEDGMKFPRGYECGSCGGYFSDFTSLDIECPIKEKSIIVQKEGETQ